MEEMFTGVSAQFLAVLETLADHKGRALTRCPPRPVTDLDEDTITDLFEELLCAGSDLVLSALNQTEGLECSTPLMQLAKVLYTINSLKLITSWRVIKRK